MGSSSASLFMEQKRKGLIQREPKKFQYILSIEKFWEAYAWNNRAEPQLNRLLLELKFTINRRADTLARKWAKKRIPAADFASEFLHAAWRLADSYHQHTDYYFYETFYLSLDRREIDVVRRYTSSKQKAFETNVVPLSEGAYSFLPSDVDIERTVTDRLLVVQALNNPVLSQEEYELLQALYENPGASYREITQYIGVDHHEKVRRMLRGIKQKLSSHLEDFR